ncbi:MAG: L,D-transpeptidase/peptidoglycan binding protein [Chloroflexota bacterium]|nr:L,D-transpeptidase/peptidoglycan binding protein [Chloroflexota bacterium]
MRGIVSSVRAAVVAVVAVALVAVAGCGEDKVAEGVRLGTLDVGGLNRDDVRRRVQRDLAGTVDERVTARHGDRRFVLHPVGVQARLDLDATVDAALAADDKAAIAPRVAFSRPALAGFVDRVAERVDRKARDADIDWHDGKLDRTRARKGIEVQRAQFVDKLVRAMANPTQRTIAVPVKVDERPDLNLQDLAKRYPMVIAVDRDAKVLRLYENLQLAKRYKIAVGQAGFETKAGRYKIVEKIVDPPWHAPNKAWAGELAGQTIPPGDPRNPLAARWLGIADGQGIHGTKDIESLGTAASHGCIRMSVEAVKEVYRQVKKGTPVFLQ